LVIAHNIKIIVTIFISLFQIVYISNTGILISQSWETDPEDSIQVET